MGVCESERERETVKNFRCPKATEAKATTEKRNRYLTTLELEINLLS